MLTVWIGDRLTTNHQREPRPFLSQDAESELETKFYDIMGGLFFDMRGIRFCSKRATSICTPLFQR